MFGDLTTMFCWVLNFIYLFDISDLSSLSKKILTHYLGKLFLDYLTSIYKVILIFYSDSLFVGYLRLHFSLFVFFLMLVELFGPFCEYEKSKVFLVSKVCVYFIFNKFYRKRILIVKSLLYHVYAY